MTILLSSNHLPAVVGNIILGVRKIYASGYPLGRLAWLSGFDGSKRLQPGDPREPLAQGRLIW